MNLSVVRSIIYTYTVYISSCLEVNGNKEVVCNLRSVFFFSISTAILEIENCVIAYINQSVKVPSSLQIYGMGNIIGRGLRLSKPCTYIHDLLQKMQLKVII